MRIFYTASDIEDLAASGVRQLDVGPGVTLTGAAKELAEQLGIALVTPGSKAVASSKAVAPSASQSGAAKSAPLPARPRGCQHGPLAAPGSAGGGPVVEQLVDAVSALKKSAR
jgi:hypothetical protein